MYGKALFVALVLLIIGCVHHGEGLYHYRQGQGHFWDTCEQFRRCCGSDNYNEGPDWEETPERAKSEEPKFAACEVKPNPSKLQLNDTVKGVVHFRQGGEDRDLQVAIQLSGFNANDEHVYHGFHIHARGTVGNGCEGAGPHYNPFATLHGGPLSDKDNRHVGDLGNILESSDGTVFTHFSDDLASLYGPQNVMGRAIVIHQKKDDLGRGGDAESTKTGNAGARLACCVIAAADGVFWRDN